MDTTTIADYQVFKDGNVYLSRPPVDEDHVGAVVFNWHIPSDIHASQTTRQNPILSFKVRVFEETKFAVFINGRIALEPTLAPDNVKVFWEVISWRDIFPERHREIEEVRFEVLEGRMRISDVVMWYQINR